MGLRRSKTGSNLSVVSTERGGAMLIKTRYINNIQYRLCVNHVILESNYINHDSLPTAINQKVMVHRKLLLATLILVPSIRPPYIVLPLVNSSHFYL
jgi:hypothetical protein